MRIEPEQRRPLSPVHNDKSCYSTVNNSRDASESAVPAKENSVSPSNEIEEFDIIKEQDLPILTEKSEETLSTSISKVDEVEIVDKRSGDCTAVIESLPQESIFSSVNNKASEIVEPVINKEQENESSTRDEPAGLSFGKKTTVVETKTVPTDSTSIKRVVVSKLEPALLTNDENSPMAALAHQSTIEEEIYQLPQIEESSIPTVEASQELSTREGSSDPSLG